MQANNNIIPQHRSDVPEKDAIVSYGFFSERLVQLIPSVVFVVNIQDEKIVFANNRVEELLGYEKGDLDKIDHNFIHLVHPDDRILIMSRIKYLCSVKIDTEDSIICRLQHQSGKYIHHCLHVTTISHGNYDDKITSILIIAVENKEEEGVLQELDKARELTKEVEKILGFGTYEWDIDAGIFRWSEGLYHIFGYENNVDSID
ncbi:MAG: PAS domain-containing protein, partial [Bacteroidota bacterium]